MGDRWIENFPCVREMCLSNRKRYFCYEILRYEIFRKNREKCNALQKIPKIGRNLQRAANF